MFFQFSPPVKEVPKKVAKKEVEKEQEVLSLAPFTPNPKIFFENIKIGKTAVEKLIIRNPKDHKADVTAYITLTEEISIDINWEEQCIEPQNEVVLEVAWTPQTDGIWRVVLHIKGNNVWKQVPIVLKSVKSPKQRTKSARPKRNGLPRFVAKKTKSPIHNTSFKKKSPLKRSGVPNIPPIQVFSPEQKYAGKENVVPDFNIMAGPSRRDTYTVNQHVPQDPVFDDSLEKITPITSPTISFEKKLESESFVLSSVLTPVEANFNPDNCSTDEKSANSIGAFSSKRTRLFDEDANLADLSSATYNLSSETYTKDISLSSGLLELSPRTPPSSSKKSRLESLKGAGVKDSLEANLWVNSKPKAKRCLLTIKEESSIKQTPLNCKSESTFTVKEESVSRQTPLKRKSELTFTISPKRPNLNSPRVINWTKKNTASIVDPVEAQWLERQELNFQKWLNALLAPPSDLHADDREHPIDVTKLWKKCQKMETIPLRSFDLSSSRLTALRKAALAMYRSSEVQEVLTAVFAAVDSNKLSIRKDRDIHLDLSIQTELMAILMSYNPLWLRLGLETVYGKAIQLKSNSDIVGLTTFLWQRFIRDPVLLKKYKSVHTPLYTTDIKKFILKKYLALVYFLDYAKMRKLIPHDPCLFCKNAPVKDSREALLRFSKEALASMGDVTKYLKHFKYIVHHEQTYLNEFNYTVNCLGSDLRDGVILTRVMEIILLENNLSNNLRVPAISRLQKVHNMTIVFDALQKSGFETIYGITPKDIVDGHKEKTLSFLWQIIYKFQTPLMAKNVTIITKWWRSSAILRKREYLKKRQEAARKIQSWYRAKKRNSHEQIKAAVTIQSCVRMFLAKRRFQKLKYCVLFFEKIYLSNQLMRRERDNFESLKYATLVVQRRWRAQLAMRTERIRFETLKFSTIMIQRKFRAKLVAKLEHSYFLKLRECAVFVQRQWRAKLAMRAEMALKYAAVVIQRKWRATLAMRTESIRFEALKEAAVVLQRRYRAKLEVDNFQKLKRATIVIQRKWRATLAMRTEAVRFQTMKGAALVLQRRYRARTVAKLEFDNFQKLKRAAVVIQSKWRATLAMRTESVRLQSMKEAAIVLQRRYRANTVAKLEFNNFQRLKQATIVIQRKLRATLAMKTEADNFQRLKRASIAIQRKWRATLAMRTETDHFQKLKRAAIVIQRKWRATLAMRTETDNFQRFKQAAIVIQRKWRATSAMRTETVRFQTMKEAAVVLQRRYRAKREFNHFQRLKRATIAIQSKWRATLAMRTETVRFQSMKEAAIVLQRRYRARTVAKLQFNNFQRLKQATVVIQRKWRATLEMRAETDNFQRLKRATIVIQRKWRATLATRTETDNLRRLKGATIAIQRKWRATLAMRTETNNFQRLKRATIAIQRKWRAILRIETKRLQTIKEAVVVIQRRYRAMAAAKLELHNFHSLKQATIFIQRKWRGTLAMRTEAMRFQTMKKAAVVLQRRYRARTVAKLEFNNFQTLKRATLVIQRKWRATLAMRIETKRLQTMKEAAVVIQQRYRAMVVATLEFNNFHRLKQATIFIQRKLRATLAMRTEATRYQTMKKAAIVLQRRYRAQRVSKLEFNHFQTLKRATITIQRQWRATLAMRIEIKRFQSIKKAAVLIQRRYRETKGAKQECDNFQKLKNATIFVQRRWRAKRAMRIQMAQYEILKKAAVVIQQRYRAAVMAKLESENFQTLKKATLVIQRKWRATLEMRQDMKTFLSLRSAAISVQRRFRAKLEFDSFQNLKKVTIFVQSKWRAKIAMRAEREKFQALKEAAIRIQRRYRELLIVKKTIQQRRDNEAIIVVQKHVRGFLIRQRYADFLKPEAVAARRLMRIQSKAAAKIQATWRGYKSRCSQAPVLYKIYERLKKANEEAVPERTLGSRCKKSITELSTGTLTISEILRVLKDIDYITRRCRQSLTKLAPVVTKVLYDTIGTTNRSPAETQICTAAASILINCYRYEPTRIYTWKPEYIEQIITVMLHFCDKESPLFPTLCTLMWFFLHHEEYKQVIVSSRKFREKMAQIKEKCTRKAKMISKIQVNYPSFFVAYTNLPLPSPTPDWGLESKDKPKTFSNSIHAFNCLCSIVDF